MKSRNKIRREKRQEQLEKVQLFHHKFSIVATAIATIVIIIELLIKLL